MSNVVPSIQFVRSGYNWSFRSKNDKKKYELIIQKLIPYFKIRMSDCICYDIDDYIPQEATTFKIEFINEDNEYIIKYSSFASNKSAKRKGKYTEIKRICDRRFNKIFQSGTIHDISVITAMMILKESVFKRFFMNEDILSNNPNIDSPYLISLHKDMTDCYSLQSILKDKKREIVLKWTYTQESNEDIMIKKLTGNLTVTHDNILIYNQYEYRNRVNNDGRFKMFKSL